MTPTDDRRSRNCSGTPPQGVPVPQPVFTTQANMPLSAGQNVPLRYSMPVESAMAGQYPQAGYSGPAPMLPPPVPVDVFGVGLDGPTRYTAPRENAQAGSSR